MGHVTSLKILVIGNCGVGKTSITQAFIKGDYNTTFPPTIGVYYTSKVINVNGDRVRLGIWDTAGMERFRAITSNYYRDAHGAIFVYDVSAPVTLTKLNDWIDELRFYSTKENIVCLLVGNKIDKVRAIPIEKGQQFALEHKMMFMESSVVNKEGINLAFEKLARKIIETPGLVDEKDGPSNICISCQERRKRNENSCLNFTGCYK